MVFLGLNMPFLLLDLIQTGLYSPILIGILTRKRQKMITIPYINKPFSKTRLKQLVSWALLRFGPNKTLALVEELKDLGYVYATCAGISLSIDDLLVPTKKAVYLKRAQTQLKQDEDAVAVTHLTSVQYFSRVITVWTETNEMIKDELIHDFKQTDTLNPVYMMAFSGARGNISQVRQLVGMRGLMSDPNGQIIDFVIESNFREGLSLTEYIIACYGSRKGVVDTALKTATSGYLTRRLVDVAQHVLISGPDCFSSEGLKLSALNISGRQLLPLKNRLVGRVLSHDVYDKASKTWILRNQECDETLASRLSHHAHIRVRSPLTCQQLEKQVCQLCYGWNLALGRLVSFGVTIGVIAAQSIGEPGTQLTMRTFHTGGVFSGDGSVSGEIRCVCVGLIDFPKPCAGLIVKTNQGKIAFLTKLATVILVKQSLPFQKIHYIHMPSHSLIFVKQGQKVYPNLALGEVTYLNQPVNESAETTFSPFNGEIRFETFMAVTRLFDEKSPLKIQRQAIAKRRQRTIPEMSDICFQDTLKRQQKHKRLTLTGIIGPSRFWLLGLEKQSLLQPCKSFLKPGDLVEKHSAVLAYGHKTTQTHLNLNLNVYQAHFYFLVIVFPFILLKHYDYAKRQRWLKKQNQNGFTKGTKMKNKPTHPFCTSYRPKPCFRGRETPCLYIRPLKNDNPPFKRLSLNVNQTSGLHLKPAFSHGFYTTYSKKRLLTALLKKKTSLQKGYPLMKLPKASKQASLPIDDCGCIRLVYKLLTSPVSLTTVWFWSVQPLAFQARLTYRKPYAIKKRVRELKLQKRDAQTTRKLKREVIKRDRRYCILDKLGKIHIARRSDIEHENRREQVKEDQPLHGRWKLDKLKVTPVRMSLMKPYVFRKRLTNDHYYAKPRYCKVTQQSLLRVEKESAFHGKKRNPLLTDVNVQNQASCFKLIDFSYGLDSLIHRETEAKVPYFRLSIVRRQERVVMERRLRLSMLSYYVKTNRVLRRKMNQPKCLFDTKHRFYDYLDLPSQGLVYGLYGNPIKTDKTNHKNLPQQINQVKKQVYGRNKRKFKKRKRVYMVAREEEKRNQAFMIHAGWTNTKHPLDWFKLGLPKTNPNINGTVFKPNSMQRFNPSASPLSPDFVLGFAKPFSSTFKEQNLNLFEKNKNQGKVSYLTLYANLAFKQVHHKMKRLNVYTTNEKQPRSVKVAFGLLLLFRQSVFHQCFASVQTHASHENKRLTRSWFIEQDQTLRKPMNPIINLFGATAVPKAQLRLNRIKVKQTLANVMIVLSTESKNNLQPLTKHKQNDLRHFQQIVEHDSPDLGGFESWCHNWRNYGMLFFKTCAKFHHRLKQSQSFNRINPKTFSSSALKTRDFLYYDYTICLDFHDLNDETHVETYLITKLTYKHTFSKTQSKKRSLNPIKKQPYETFIQKKYDNTLMHYHVFFRLLYFQIYKLPNLTQAANGQQQHPLRLNIQKIHHHPWPRYQPSLNLKSIKNPTFNGLNSKIQNNTKLNHFHFLLNVDVAYVKSKAQITNRKISFETKTTKTRKVPDYDYALGSKSSVKGFLKKKTWAKNLVKNSAENPAKSSATIKFQEQKLKSWHLLRFNKPSQRFSKLQLKQNWLHHLNKKPNQAKVKAYFSPRPLKILDSNRKYALKKVSSSLKRFLHKSQYQQTQGLIGFKYLNHYLRFKSTKAVLAHGPRQSTNADYVKKRVCLKRNAFRQCQQTAKMIKTSLKSNQDFFVILLNAITYNMIHLDFHLCDHESHVYKGLALQKSNETNRLNHNLITTSDLTFFRTLTRAYGKRYQQDFIELVTKHVENVMQPHTCRPTLYGRVGQVFDFSSGLALTTETTNFRGELVAPFEKEQQETTVESAKLAIQQPHDITLDISGQPLTKIYAVTHKNLINYALGSKNAPKNYVLGGYIRATTKATQSHRFPHSGQIFFLGKENIILRRADCFLIPDGNRGQLNNYGFVDQHSPLLTLRYKSLTTGDIVQGIPKIERIFEGRTIARFMSLQSLVNQTFNAYFSGFVTRPDYRDRLFFKVLQELQLFAIDAVQNIYQSQGVNIADKHLEIIIKQMTEKVFITHPGETSFFVRDQIPLNAVKLANLSVIKKAIFWPHVNGITKTALSGQGFLAPASFQDTIRVLGYAAMTQRPDFLKGLKGNVILGYMIPMGTHRTTA